MADDPSTDGPQSGKKPDPKPRQEPELGAVNKTWEAFKPAPLNALLGKFVPLLTILTLVAFIGLCISGLLFAILIPSGGLFVLSVQTTRLDYEASGQARGQIWVDGVLIRAGKEWVVDASKFEKAAEDAAPGPHRTIASHPGYFCYTGFVSPAPGVQVELAVSHGQQILHILPAPVAENPTSATLSIGTQELALTTKPETKPKPRKKQAVDALVLTLPDQDDAPIAGVFKLEDTIEIYADPDCASVAIGSQDFGLDGEAITIEGPAVLGRKLRQANDTRVVDDDIPLIQGNVEIIIRQVLCAERLLSVFLAKPQRNRGGCGRIFRVKAEPISIPSGSTLLSQVSQKSERAGRSGMSRIDKPAPFFGVVVFENGHYRVNASTEADQFIILRPGAGGSLRDGNALSVPIIDRVLLEPSLLFFAWIFLTLSGLLIGILQVVRLPRDA